MRGVEQLLREEPYRFEFVQAVRLLGCLAPGREPPGRPVHPRQEFVHFRSHVHLNFPASELVQLEAAEPPERPEQLVVNFFGLAGPKGALPYPYTEWLIGRLSQGDPSGAAFFDLFNHRLIALFYRAWEKHHPIVAFERSLCHAEMRRGTTTVVTPRAAAPAVAPETTPPATYLLELVGLGLPSLRGRMDVPDRVLVYYAGLFALQCRSALGLERMLGEYFGVAIRVEPFRGQWLRLAAEDRTALGRRHSRLGPGGVVLGERVWDTQSRICLRIGPLGLEEFLAWQPGTPAYRALVQLTRSYARIELDVEVQLVLRADEVPAATLGPSGPAPGVSLGRVAWLRHRERPHPRDGDEARSLLPLA